MVGLVKKDGVELTEWSHIGCHIICHTDCHILHHVICHISMRKMSRIKVIALGGAHVIKMVIEESKEMFPVETCCSIKFSLKAVKFPLELLALPHSWDESGHPQLLTIPPNLNTGLSNQLDSRKVTCYSRQITSYFTADEQTPHSNDDHLPYFED